MKRSLTFHFNEDEDWYFENITRVDEMRIAFDDIDSVLRTQIKHGEDEKISDFAERIRDMLPRFDR